MGNRDPRVARSHLPAHHKLPASSNKLQTSSEKTNSKLDCAQAHCCVKTSCHNREYVGQKKLKNAWSPLLDSPLQQIHPALPPGARVMAGSLQLVSRLAGGHAAPEEKWVTLHPSLFIAAYRGNLPAAMQPDRPLCTPCHLHMAPQEQWLPGGSSTNCGRSSARQALPTRAAGLSTWMLSEDFVLLLLLVLKPVFLVLLKRD